MSDSAAFKVASSDNLKTAAHTLGMVMHGEFNKTNNIEKEQQ
jgi:hypothetical protein